MFHILGPWLALSAGLAPTALQAQQSGGPLSQGVSSVNRIRAQNELAEGVRSYRERDFARAEQHFERSLELDPTQPTVRFLIARAVHAQYRQGAETPENLAQARKTIRAYQDVLAQDPGNEEAYQAVAALYGAVREEERQRAWVLQRARSPSLPAKKRVEAYLLLASQDWNCAQTLTKPQDVEAAKRCATRGLELAREALRLGPDNESAWSSQTNLLLALARLAEREGRSSERAEFEKQAALSQRRFEEVREENQKKAATARSY